MPPTPTPGGDYYYQLASGAIGTVSMRISAGEILIALLLLMIVILLFVLIWVIAIRQERA